MEIVCRNIVTLYVLYLYDCIPSLFVECFTTLIVSNYLLVSKSITNKYDNVCII
jgi:hypothetical protein